MSLRPAVAAFSYDNLLASLCDAGAERVEALALQLGEALRPLGPDFIEEARRALREIMAGWPDPTRRETEAHVAVVDFLVARTEGYAPCEGSTYWKYAAFPALLEAAPFEPDARRLLEVFTYGRPVLGQGFDSSWSYYSFLGKRHVQQLGDALGALDPGALGPAARLVEDLRGWCAHALGRGRDLWVFWS